jgi:hypothetical protein
MLLLKAFVLLTKLAKIDRPCDLSSVTIIKDKPHDCCSLHLHFENEKVRYPT